MMRRFCCRLALAGCLLAPLQAGPSPFRSLHYRPIGPTRGGRVTAVTGVPAEPFTFYMGTTGGGVWKTTDAGRHWHNVSDGFFASPSIGALRVAPSDPETVYAGTGSDALRSNVILGRGVYRSQDAGRTWHWAGLERAGQIGALEVDPREARTLFVAAIGNPFAPNPERGVFRSRDGGRTWEKVLYLSPRTGAVDLEFRPGDPDVLYAALWRAERKPWTIISGGKEGGIYRSRDGGDHWERLEQGLPRGLVGKADLAVSRADPLRLYVLIEAPAPQGGLYRSDDGGDTFRQVSRHPGLLDRPFYYTNIDADPTDADVLYVNSTRLFRSADGGRTWRRLPTPHGDNHDIWINPGNPRIFIQGNDGGATVTLDGGRSWSSEWNQPTAEIYQVQVDDRFPYWVYGGQQDNTTIRVPSLPPYPSPTGPRGYWQEVGGCETGPAVPRPGDADIVYSNCKGRFGRYNQRTGQEQRYDVGAADMYGQNPKDLRYRFQRVAPILVSPHDPRVLYHASQYLHRSRDEGRTWERISPDLTANEPDKQVISGSPITRDITGEEFYSTLYAVAESPLEPGVLWVGANDGPVHVSRDGGQHWWEVTPADLPGGGRVSSIEASPHRKGKAYLAVYRYLLGDWQPYLFRTEDYGAHWRRLTSGQNGIPADSPTRVVREDPAREGLLFAGTETGVYLSFDDGLSWQSLQLNLPRTPVTDMRIQRGDLVLSTMGRSFWILDDLGPLEQWTPEVAESPSFLFRPRAAYRMRYRPFQGTGVEYPPPGARIDYWLGQPAQSLTLEILDRQGRVIRSFRSHDAPSGGSGPSRLETGPGLHRFLWDLRHRGPAAGAGRPLRGPLVVPGPYRVRLRVGRSSATRPLQVRIDPRVKADGVTLEDLAQQEKLSLAVLAALGRARRAAARLEKMRDDPQAAKLYRQLVEAPGPYPEPRLIRQLGYLYRILDAADQRPGSDARERFVELREELDALLLRANKLIR